MTGKEIRLSKIIKPSDGKTVSVAIDHGLSDGVLEGIEDMNRLFNDIGSNVDAVLINAGIIRKNIKVLAQQELGIIMRVDIAYLPDTKNELMINTLSGSVERALRLGAHAVAANGFLGHDYAFDSITNLSLLAESCEQWGMPLVAEMKYVGENISEPWLPKYVENGVRVAHEVGADLVKTYYTGDKSSFKAIVDNSAIPIAILGGPRKKSIKDVLKAVEDAVDAGAAGVIFGRNVWHKRDAAKMSHILYRIIHENASVDEIIKEENLPEE